MCDMYHCLNVATNLVYDREYGITGCGGFKKYREMHFYLEGMMIVMVTIQPFTNLVVPLACAAGQHSIKD